MRTSLRTLALTLASAAAIGAFAQPLPPYPVTVMGTIAGCTPTSYVNILTVQNTQPALDIDVPLTSGTCTFTIDLMMDSFNGSFVVSTPCNGVMQSQTVSYTVNSLFPDSTVVIVDFNCGTGTTDCLGVVGGTALPGTACTIPGSNLPALWTSDCICALDTMGQTFDCTGVWNGTNWPGTPCTTALGAAGTWSASCVCIADTTTTGCEAGFWVMQAYEIDSLNPNGGATPIPNLLWVWNLSTGGNGNYDFVWSWGDGTPNSTEAFPTHIYANGGPYELCLTMSSGGCTDTACDSVSVDADGIYTGMILEQSYARSGFTVNVLNELPTSIPERPLFDHTAVWPNPVEDALNLTFNTTVHGSIPMSIFDLNGRVVSTTNVLISGGNNTLRIPVGELTQGMYLLRFGNEANAVSFRFVKR
ncbi:MAG: T9SS type A sorting domain-containing protein [Flavobacteriales bacterium]|nr:T9SS type A sorting domain-containing protein [Flavobacteriales bacterium]